MHQQSVLQLDIQGTPQRWISLEQAALHYATDDVAWQEGSSPLATLRGGFNVARGEMSRIDVAPIIALRGAASINLFDIVPTVTKRRLCVRDRATCGYCGVVFAECDLEIEHILPASRGGPFTWQNLTCACRPCNARKRDRLPHEAGMPLLFVPYVPSRFEAFLLDGRRIRGDVDEWLRARLPKGSRLH